MTMLAMYIIGAPMPAIVGAVSDALGGGAAGLQHALFIPPIGGLFAALCFWQCSVHYPQDVEKVKQVTVEAA